MAKYLLIESRDPVVPKLTSVESAQAYGGRV